MHYIIIQKYFYNQQVEEWLKESSYETYLTGFDGSQSQRWFCKLPRHARSKAGQNSDDSAEEAGDMGRNHLSKVEQVRCSSIHCGGDIKGQKKAQYWGQ